MKKFETFFNSQELETLYHLVCYALIFKWKDDAWAIEKLLDLKKKMDNVTFDLQDGTIYIND